MAVWVSKSRDDRALTSHVLLTCSSNPWRLSGCADCGANTRQSYNVMERCAQGCRRLGWKQGIKLSASLRISAIAPNVPVYQFLRLFLVSPSLLIQSTILYTCNWHSSLAKCHFIRHIATTHNSLVIFTLPFAHNGPPHKHQHLQELHGSR